MLLVEQGEEGVPGVRARDVRRGGLLRPSEVVPGLAVRAGGTIPRGVRDAVEAAQAAGLSEARLVALLRRRVGLVGGGRLLDLLLEGSSDYVLDAVRATAAA